jgi:hypothetical protein
MVYTAYYIQCMASCHDNIYSSINNVCVCVCVYVWYYDGDDGHDGVQLPQEEKVQRLDAVRREAIEGCSIIQCGVSE